MFTGLKPCRECQHQVSANAKTCPNCGAKRPGEGRLFHALPGFLALLLVGSCAMAAYSQERADIDAEIKLLVFKPCAEVAAALGMMAFSETDRRRHDEDSMEAVIELSVPDLIRQKNSLALLVGEAMRRTGSPWKKRREAYSEMLKLCLEGSEGWPN